MKLFSTIMWTALIIVSVVGIACVSSDLWHPSEKQIAITALAALLYAAGGRLKND